MQDIPPHLRESVFRCYESQIAKAVKEYPKEVCFVPKTLSPYTYAARLRDAINSYRRYEWKSELIDYRKYIEYQNDMVVKLVGMKVIVASKTQSKVEERKAEVMEYMGEARSDFWRELDKPSRKVLEALCVLLSDRVLIERVKITGYSAEDLKDLTSTYDVQIIQEPEHLVLL